MSEIAEAAFPSTRSRLEKGEKQIVGVNCHEPSVTHDLEILRVSHEVEVEQVRELRRARPPRPGGHRRRDGEAGPGRPHRGEHDPGDARGLPGRGDARGDLRRAARRVGRVPRARLARSRICACPGSCPTGFRLQHQIGQDRGMTQQPFSRPGAVDLSALGRPAGPAGGQLPRAAPPRRPGRVYSIELDEQNIQAQLESSMNAPVLMTATRPRRTPRRPEVQDLETLADEFEGRSCSARSTSTRLPSSRRRCRSRRSHSWRSSCRAGRCRCSRTPRRSRSCAP